MFTFTTILLQGESCFFFDIVLFCLSAYFLAQILLVLLVHQACTQFLPIILLVFFSLLKVGFSVVSAKKCPTLSYFLCQICPISSYLLGQICPTLSYLLGQIWSYFYTLRNHTAWSRPVTDSMETNLFQPSCLFQTSVSCQGYND